MWNGINDKYGSKDANEDIVFVAYLILDEGKRRLLVVQEVSYNQVGHISMLDCRWY